MQVDPGCILNAQQAPGSLFIIQPHAQDGGWRNIKLELLQCGVVAEGLGQAADVGYLVAAEVERVQCGVVAERIGQAADV